MVSFLNHIVSILYERRLETESSLPCPECSVLPSPGSRPETVCLRESRAAVSSPCTPGLLLLLLILLLWPLLLLLLPARHPAACPEPWEARPLLSTTARRPGTCGPGWVGQTVSACLHLTVWPGGITPDQVDGQGFSQVDVIYKSSQVPGSPWDYKQITGPNCLLTGWFSVFLDQPLLISGYSVSQWRESLGLIWEFSNELAVSTIFPPFCQGGGGLYVGGQRAAKDLQLLKYVYWYDRCHWLINLTYPNCKLEPKQNYQTKLD